MCMFTTICERFLVTVSNVIRNTHFKKCNCKMTEKLICFEHGYYPAGPEVSKLFSRRAALTIQEWSRAGA